MTTPTNIPSMNRDQLIAFIESHGARYAAEDTTPLHAAAAMVEQYTPKSEQVYKLSAELSKVKRDMRTMSRETDRILSELKQTIEEKLSQ